MERLYFLSKRSGGQVCWAPGCSNSSLRDSVDGVKREYYSFPADKERHKRWTDAIPTKRKPNKSSRICSDHFFGGVKSNIPGILGNVPTIFKAADRKRKVFPVFGAKKKAKKTGSKRSATAQKKKQISEVPAPPAPPAPAPPAPPPDVHDCVDFKEELKPFPISDPIPGPGLGLSPGPNPGPSPGPGLDNDRRELKEEEE